MTKSYAEEKPIDIWNIDEEKIKESPKIDESVLKNIEGESLPEFDIYNMQSQKQNDQIQLDETLESGDVQIIGLYDPEDYGLSINMWLNSDGDQLKNIFSKLSKINLSEDATDIMKISMLTNAYYPTKNITEKEFLNYKSNWLIKNSDLDLIENFLIKNQIVDEYPNLTKYLVDEYLSQSNVNKACEIFSKNLKNLNDEYLSKFNIYCLINNNKKDEAQIILDLKKN